MKGFSMAAASRSVLIVEDNYYFAQDLAEAALAFDWRVMGPAATVAGAMALLAGDPPDFAIVDIDLSGEKSFPILDALVALDVPLVVHTSFAAEDLPSQYAALQRLRKPMTRPELGRVLEAG